MLISPFSGITSGSYVSSSCRSTIPKRNALPRPRPATPRRGRPVEGSVYMRLAAATIGLLPRAAKIIVVPPSTELRDGLAKIGATIAGEWAAAAGADGAAMLTTYRKQP